MLRDGRYSKLYLRFDASVPASCSALAGSAAWYGMAWPGMAQTRYSITVYCSDANARNERRFADGHGHSRTSRALHIAAMAQRGNID
jgi:hypothetical protein